MIYNEGPYLNRLPTGWDNMINYLSLLALQKNSLQTDACVMCTDRYIEIYFWQNNTKWHMMGVFIDN